MANKSQNNPELIKQVLEDVSKIKDIANKLSEVGDEGEELFKTSLNEQINSAITEFTGSDQLIEQISGGEPPSATVLNIEAFTKCQDSVTEWLGEWNKESAKAAVGLYLLMGEKFELSAEELETKCTVGELFNYEGEGADLETKYTKKVREGLPDTVFCGEGKTIPVTDKVEAINAFLLAPKESDSILESISEKAANFGVFSEGDKVVFAPIIIEGSTPFLPIKISSVDEAKENLENLDLIAKSYGLSKEDRTSVQTFIQEAIDRGEEYFNRTSPLLEYESDFSNPLRLGNEFLFEYFKRHEFSDPSKEYLAQIVGMVRKEKVSLETIQEAGKPYNVFGVSVLKSLLLAPVEDSSKNESTPQEQSTPGSLEHVDNPIPISTEEEKPSVDVKKGQEAIRTAELFVKRSADKKPPTRRNK